MNATSSQMKIFVEVARRQGFTAAAKELNVSKSHISKQVERLEEHLGVRLLHRTTRQVSLSEEGQIYYQRCQQILEDIEDAQRAITQLRTTPAGTLRLTAPMTFGLKYLNGLICEFLEQYPDLDAEVHFSDQVVGLVETNVDAAVRIGELKDSSLVGRRLAPVQMLTVASPNYLAEHGEPKHPDELREHSCLRYSYQVSGTTWYYRGADGRELNVRVDGRISANNGRALTEAACAGLGIHLAPDFILAEAVRSGALKPILSDWKSRTLALWVVYPDRRFLSQRVRFFVDFLAEKFADGAPWSLAGEGD